MNIDDFLFLIPVVFIVFIILWLGWRLHRAWNNFLFWVRRKRGRKGELEAIKLLKSEGFEVLETQVTYQGSVWVDNDELSYDIRPDLIVQKNGEKFLAEIKTGRAAEPSDRNTRRQLREYAAVAGDDSVVLVDATKGNVQLIRFEE